MPYQMLWGCADGKRSCDVPQWQSKLSKNRCNVSVYHVCGKALLWNRARSLMLLAAILGPSEKHSHMLQDILQRRQQKVLSRRGQKGHTFT